MENPAQFWVEINTRASELLADHPDYRLLRTIPGIGPVNALAVLAEAGDLRRFRHHRQLLKFCGMDFATVQSELFRGKSKISKYGDSCKKYVRTIASTQVRTHAYTFDLLTGICLPSNV